MPPIDHELTHPLPRAPSDTGPLPALACPCRPCPAWRRTLAVALVLAWVALAEAAWWLGRVAWLLWAWR